MRSVLNWQKNFESQGNYSQHEHKIKFQNILNKVTAVSFWNLYPQ